MDMGALPVDTFPRMTHDRDGRTLIYCLTNVDGDGLQMGVKAVLREPVKAMFDDHIPAVVRTSAARIRVNNGSAGNRLDDIFGLAGSVPV
jgi:hypothetical protein